MPNEADEIAVLDAMQAVFAMDGSAPMPWTTDALVTFLRGAKGIGVEEKCAEALLPLVIAAMASFLIDVMARPEAAATIQTPGNVHSTPN
jgi:hypothetical protein